MDQLISPTISEKEKITIDTDRLHDSAKSTFHFEQEDNKDKVWEEIFEMEQRIRRNGGEFPLLPTNPGTHPNPAETRPRKRYSPPRVTIKTEPDAYAHDPSFEFESSEKGSTASIKPSTIITYLVLYLITLYSLVVNCNAKSIIFIFLQSLLTW